MSITGANGLVTTLTYKPRGKVIGYDAASRITTRTLGNRSAVSGSSGYGYDALDRLTSATGSSTIAYGYDASGNRSSQTLNSSATSYTIDPASNRIASVSGPLPVTPGYDANGSLTSTGNGTPAASYGYDARRVRPGQQRAADAFRTVVAANCGRFSSPFDDLVERPDDPCGR